MLLNVDYDLSGVQKVNDGFFLTPNSNHFLLGLTGEDIGFAHAVDDVSSCHVVAAIIGDILNGHFLFPFRPLACPLFPCCDYMIAWFNHTFN